MLNKGKIIDAQRVGVTGQLITSIGLTVTREMMPSFRLVAFYSIPWENNEEVVSDSVWVDVADSCAGGVRGHHTTNSAVAQRCDGSSAHLTWCGKSSAAKEPKKPQRNSPNNTKTPC